MRSHHAARCNPLDEWGKLAKICAKSTQIYVAAKHASEYQNYTKVTGVRKKGIALMEDAPGANGTPPCGPSPTHG